MSLSVSIIICTYNGLKRLPNTLDFILKQRSKAPFELIVVDNNSIDQTPDFVNRHLADCNIDWKIVHEPEPGLSHARWRGIAEASNDLVLFCDDDNHLSSNYIETGVSYFFKNSNLGILGGLGSPKFASHKPAWFDQFSHSYAVGSSGKEPGIQAKGSFHYGAGCFFRKSALMHLKSKGFVSVLSDRKGGGLSSGGDVELCYAVQLLGFDLAFDPELRFDHWIETHRLDWNYYLKLKRGIASSFPLLESYKIQVFDSKFAFKLYVLKRYFTVLKGILKLKLTRTDSLESQVSFAVLSEKFKAFGRNYTSTLVAFERNRRFFNA